MKIHWNCNTNLAESIRFLRPKLQVVGGLLVLHYAVFLPEAEASYQTDDRQRICQDYYDHECGSSHGVILPHRCSDIGHRRCQMFTRRHRAVKGCHGCWHYRLDERCWVDWLQLHSARQSCIVYPEYSVILMSLWYTVSNASVLASE